MYVADACHLKKPPCQIQTQYNLNQGVIESYTLVAMATALLKQRGMC